MAYMGRSTAVRCALAGLFMLVFTSETFSAGEASPGELLKESFQLMAAEKYEEAATVMSIYLDTVGDSEAPRVIAIAQDIRFKLASILITELKQLDYAAEVLKVYIDKPLGKYPRKARNMLATCYYELEAYEDCVIAARDALEYNENPVIVVRSVSSENAAMSTSTTNEEDDPEFTPKELVALHLTLGEAYFGSKKWAECIEPFTYVIENTTDGSRKGYAIMQIVNALINIPDFDRITAWIPQLYRTEARYDIRVNLALMNTAVALYDAREYDSALPLYRMILPRDEVLGYQQKNLRDMRVEAGLPPEEGMEISEGERILFGIDQMEEGADAAETKPKALLELEALVSALENLPPYENDIDYRMAQIYRKVDRYWEAVRYLDKVYAANPANELGKRAIYEVIQILLENLDELAEAEERGFGYMAEYKEGITPRQVAYLLTSHYHQAKTMEPLKALLPYIDSFVRTNDSSIVKYDAELYFMQSVADLVLYNFEGSEKGFKRILDEFPESHQESNALYWYGISKLSLQKYAEAWSVFEDYTGRFPKGEWIDEVYFQSGICLFGLEKYVEAFERFSLVIKNYPDSPIFSDACSMRGDLYGAGVTYEEDDYLEKAVADYEMAIASATTAKRASYPVYKMADIFEAEERYNEIVKVVQAYLDQWGSEADIAKALFWIGKTRIQQGFVDEAVRTYIDAIVKFGGDVRQDGVDMMISELVKVSAIWLSSEAQEKLVSDLQAALKATDNLVLQLRLRVTIAKINRTEIELGKQLIKELPDLKSASPPILATICDASFEMQDYSRAQELLDIFITRFEDSDFKRAAFRLLSYGQYAEQDYEGALKTIEEAQETYGNDRDVVWAQLMMAKIYLDMGKIEEARAANKYVFAEPVWRGEPVAQATFQLGQVEEKAGDPRKAFGYYQRTYAQYKGHAGGYWAAESYLASARCLQKMGLAEERRNTFLAMLYDSYVNDLPQAEIARKELASGVVAGIEKFISAGGRTNIVIAVETGEMLDSAEVQMNDVESADTGGDTMDASATETNMAESAEMETNMVDVTEGGGES